jgi:hypothetical protein
MRFKYPTVICIHSIITTDVEHFLGREYTLSRALDTIDLFVLKHVAERCAMEVTSDDTRLVVQYILKSRENGYLSDQCANQCYWSIKAKSRISA